MASRKPVALDPATGRHQNLQSGDTLTTPDGLPYLTTDAQFLLVEGCECSVNAGNTQYLDLASGKASIDVSGVRYVVTPTAFTKRLNAAWAIGTNAGGLLTGSSFPASTTLHCYVMRRRTDGTVDHGFHTSATQSTFTDGSSNVWDLRLHMSITTLASSIRPFKQNGSLVQYLTPAPDVTAVIGTTAALYTLSIPTGLKLQPIARAHLGTQSSSGFTFFYFSDPDCVDLAPDTSYQNGNTGAFMAGAYLYTSAASIERLYSNTSAQIRGRASATASNTIVTTFGYIHPRGGNPTAAQTIALNPAIVQLNTFYSATQLTTTSTTYVDSGFSISLTNPIKSGNKIRIRAFIPTGNSAAGGFTNLTFYRNGTTDINTVGGAGLAVTVAAVNSSPITGVIEFIDTPDTTTPTYNLYWKTGSGSSYINRRGSSTAAVGFTTITLEEIAV